MPDYKKDKEARRQRISELTSKYEKPVYTPPLESLTREVFRQLPKDEPKDEQERVMEHYSGTYRHTDGDSLLETDVRRLANGVQQCRFRWSNMGVFTSSYRRGSKYRKFSAEYLITTLQNYVALGDYKLYLSQADRIAQKQAKAQAKAKAKREAAKPKLTPEELETKRREAAEKRSKTRKSNKLYKRIEDFSFGSWLGDE